MKNLSFLLITFLSITNVWSQTGFQLSPSPKSETTSSYNYAPQAVGDLVLTWLTSETMATAYGLQGAGRIAAYMELAPEDITEYSNAIGGRPLNIKQVQFYIRTDQLSVVTAAHVSIRKGTSLVASTEVVNQSVNLTGGWNYIDLNQEYALDATQSVYIGYQVTSSKEGYPIGVASGNVAKQGWLYVNENQSVNVAPGGYGCMIKAVATAPANAFIIHSLNIPDHTLLGEKLSVEGILENIGTTNITSFSLLYQTNGVNSAVHNFTGLDIAPYDLYTFKHPDSLAIDETKT
ncbi:MAG: hypothetical protein LBH12_00140, partial [Dysgonamonadaceae bacterium]|nr:hypothetical protein [Dysgonamonadaceae bacterium]